MSFNENSEEISLIPDFHKDEQRAENHSTQVESVQNTEQKEKSSSENIKASTITETKITTQETTTVINTKVDNVQENQNIHTETQVTQVEASLDLVLVPEHHEISNELNAEQLAAINDKEHSSQETNRSFPEIQSNETPNSSGSSKKSFSPISKKINKSQAAPIKKKNNLTIPKEFSFATTKRLTEKTKEKKKFQAAIENKSEHLNKKFRPTVPKPFDFPTDRRPNRDQFGSNAGSKIHKSPYISLAQKINNTFHKTPERFRKPRRNMSPTRQMNFKGTTAHSPNLSTKIRSELYRKTSSDIQKYNTSFKAHPVNYSILNAKKPIGVPDIKKVPPTVPISPIFHRTKSHHTSSTDH